MARRVMPACPPHVPHTPAPLAAPFVWAAPACRSLLEEAVAAVPPPPPGSDCASQGPEWKDGCCTTKALAGVVDASCPAAPGSTCAAVNPADREKCCADKVAADIYDDSCTIGDDCASWPPVHRAQCCKGKAALNETDSLCFALVKCSAWSAPDLYEACCAEKDDVGAYDATCAPGSSCGTVRVGFGMQHTLPSVFCLLLVHAHFIMRRLQPCCYAH